MIMINYLIIILLREMFKNVLEFLLKKLVLRELWKLKMLMDFELYPVIRDILWVIYKSFISL
jgi:hypothetical protein